MTVIENNSPKVQYTGPYDIGQLLPLTFPYDQPEDVHMQIGSTEATYNTEYFISGLTPESVTLKEPIDSGVLITIYRETPLDQQSDFPQNARFSSKRIEDALDKLCMEQQEQEEKLTRCLVASISLTGFNGALPEAKAGSALIWNETETGFINTDLDLSAEGMADIENVSTHISSVINCSDNMGAITLAPDYADKAKKWAEGQDSEVAPLGGTHSAKRWAEMYSHVYVGDVAPTDEEVDVWLCPSGEIVDSAIKTCADNIDSIRAVAGDLSNIDAVYSNATNINTVAGNITNVNTVGSISSNVTTVAGISSAISTVSSNISNVTTVAGISSDVSAVAGISSAVTAVNSNSSNINAVAGNATNINAVAGNSTNINAVATNETNINAVATNETNINTCATNISAITNALTYANSASNSAGIATSQAQIATQQTALAKQYAEETHGQSDVMVENVRAIPAYENYGYTQTESEGLADLKKFNRSTFDLSKFTAAGTPTITDDGIASGFSSSNGVVTSAKLLPSSTSWKCQMRYVYNNLVNTYDILLSNTVAGTGFYLNLVSAGIFFGITCESGNPNIQFYAGTQNNFSQGDVLDITCGYDAVEQKYFLSIDKNGAFYASEKSSQTTETVKQTGAGYIKLGGGWVRYVSGSIDLKQLSVTVDGVEVFNGNKSGIDTIKADDFTKVGTPTITENGIITAPNDTSYLDKSITLAGTEFKFTGSFRTIDDLPQGSVYGLYDGDIGTSSLYGQILNASGFLYVRCYFRLGGSGTFTSPRGHALQKNTKYFYENTYNTSTGLNTVNIYTENGTLYDTASNTTTVSSYTTIQDISVAKVNIYGEMDLNDFKVYIDGNLVYQPLLRIPYNQTKTGLKIVDSYYRDRVNDMYSQYGWANYYTLSDTDFTVPMGENLDGHVTKVDWYKNGTTSWEYDTNLDCIETGSCTSGTAVTLPKPMADDTYSLSVPYSAKSKTGFTPSASGDYIAKGKVVLG